MLRRTYTKYEKAIIAKAIKEGVTGTKKHQEKVEELAEKLSIPVKNVKVS